MPLGGPGPRDWSPPSTPSTPITRREARPWGYAALSMLLGGGSVVLALVEPQHAGVASGFIASSIGITAIVLGLKAMQVSAWWAPTSRAFGRGGIILGAVGSALMAYAVIATALLSAGLAALPALSLPIADADGPLMARGLPIPGADEPPGGSAYGDGSADVGDTAQGGGTPVVPPGTDPVPAPYAVPGLPPIVDRGSEAEALMISTGWLAYSIRDHFSPGSLPETLIVGSSAPQRVLLADETPLTPVPDGTRVLYQVSRDRTQFNVTLIGGTYGAVATLSSAVGTVEAS